MRVLKLLLLVAICAASKTKRSLLEQVNQPILLTEYSNSNLKSCDGYKDVTYDYRASLYEFSVRLYKSIAERGNYHFVFSPFSIWRILAALAEGADPIAQQQLLAFLSLPNDPCIRQKFYDLMNRRITPGDDVKISNTRTLIVDEDLKLNTDWLNNIVFKNSMLQVIHSPIKRYPALAANYIKQFISTPSESLNLGGNSVILDSIELDGLWTTAFSDAVIQRAPFYDQSGQQIGAVDLMTMKKRVRMAYVPSMNMKIMELPVGLNSRYRVVFGLLLSETNDLMPNVDKLSSRVVFELLDNLKESQIPIEVAIPRFTMISEINVKSILEDMGLPNLWTDSALTKFVSEPAAMPSSFIQRAAITLDRYGLTPSSPILDVPCNATTGLDLNIGRDFIANRPLLFSIMDAETYSCILCAAYSQPTYKL